MFRKLLAFLTLSVVMAGGVNASTYRLVLQSGHESLPVSVKWHEDSSTVVSVGEDGRLIVTDPTDGLVLHRFRVTSEQVHDLALDPSSDKAAVVSRDGDGFIVSVWDWGSERLLYDYELDAEPLFLSWSAKGRYLTIGNLGSPSVIVLEGRSGRRLSYLQRLPSLYNAGYIGSTETILMTYASSGSIRYWDIRSSVLKLSTETISSMVDPTVVQTGRKASLFGRRNETLFLVNRQTGAVQDRIDIAGLVDVSVDPATGEVDALSVNLAGYQLHRFFASEEEFVPRVPYEPTEEEIEELEESGGMENFPDYKPIALDPVLKPVKILRREASTYLMDENGELISDRDGTFDVVINDRVWRPDDLAFAGESIYLSNGGDIQRFTSEFFSADSRGDSNDLNELKLGGLSVNCASGDSGLLSLDGGEMIHWDRAGSGTGNGYRMFDFENGETESVEIRGSLQKLKTVDETRLLMVDRSGNVVLRNTENGMVLGSYTALGILDAAYDTEGEYALIGRSSAGRAGTAIEEVDLRTGESIPVADTRFMIYGVIPGPGGIYSIGIDRSGGDSKTVILLHEQGDSKKTRKVYEKKGEYLNADVLPMPDGRGIFITIGNEVLKISGSRRTTYDWDEPIMELGYRGSVVYGIDIDGALVMWKSTGGDPLMKVYFFDDGGWIAMPPENDRIWTSPGAVDNVVLYKDGRPVTLKRISSTGSGSGGS